MEKVVALLLSSCMLNTGCTSNSATDNIHLQSAELRVALSEDLKHRGIWYENIGQDSIRFKKTDKETVVKALEDISNTFLPIGRSASYAPHLQKIFKERLNKAGILYRTQVHDGMEWIIWSEVDKKTVHEIENGIQQLITSEQIK